MLATQTPHPAVRHVYIVDADPDASTMIQTLLKSLGNVSVELYADERKFLAAQPQESSPSCVITELRLPYVSGHELLRRVGELGFEHPIIIYTAVRDVEAAVEAMKLGAADYLVKPVRPQRLVEAVQLALERDEAARATASSDWRNRFGTLTGRESEVLQMLMQGLSSKQIAAKLHISKKTVGFHRGNIVQKIGAGSTAELVALAVRHWEQS